MAVEQGKLKTPEENYEDAALELALYRMLRHEHEMVKANSSEDDEKETQRIAAESTPRIFALIERRTKRREGNSFKRQSARFLKAVACVVLVANMGLTIATATSAPVRAKVMDFLTEINASYMSMGFRETELEIDVPENWEGSYYPTFLPEGYMLQFSESDKGKNEAEYTDVQGETLRIKDKRREHEAAFGRSCIKAYGLYSDKQNQYGKRRGFACESAWCKCYGSKAALRRNRYHLGQWRSIFHRQQQ